MCRGRTLGSRPPEVSPKEPLFVYARMFLAVQFPIADGRRFASEPPPFAGPEWPAPKADLNPEFIRQFGHVALRAGGADAAWNDEYAFCSAKRAIRFPDLRAARLGRDDRVFVPSCAFRRLFHDGKAVARVEVGLGHDQRRGRPLYALSDTDLTAILAGLFRLKTQTGLANGQSSTRELVLQGPHLARIYAAASVRGRMTGYERLVRAGIPTAVLEFDSEYEVARPPLNVIDVSAATADEEVILWFCRVQTPYGSIPTWFIGQTSRADRGSLRSLRLCLLRLHAEQQVLDLVLSMIARGELVYEPGTDAGEALEVYLNSATNFLNREYWRGTAGSRILDALDATANAATPGQRAVLDRRLQGVRLQIARKVDRYQAEREGKVGVTTITVMGDYVGHEQKIYGGTFHGPVVNAVAAERIEGSFNVTTASGASDEVKEQLKVLHTEVAKLVEAMTAQGVGDPEEVVNNLETFAKQAVEKRPLRQVLEVTGRALIDTANFVAQSAAPIAAAVTAIMKATGIA